MSDGNFVDKLGSLFKTPEGGGLLSDKTAGTLFPYLGMAGGKAPSNKDLINAAILRGSLELLKPRQPGENLASQASRALQAGQEPLKTMAQKWLKFWKSQKFKVVASELPLYSSKFDCCGTNDVIVTKDSWNGQNAVLDWKTSKDYSFEQAIQVEMYRRFIEETTDFKIQKLAVVNIPKEPQKEVSMYVIKIDEKYFKGFKAMKYIDKLESEFNADLKQWKKENKKNAK